MNFWQVDAFTRAPFKGNPAAVFILKEPLADELMQNIAMEMNQSETAFILLREGRNPLLRWFTPSSEVDLCGHATLASAHIYLTEIAPDLGEITFDTKSVGSLKVTKHHNGYTMDLPSRAGEEVNLNDIPQFVLDALSDTQPIAAYQSRDLMLVYADENTIYKIVPDYNELMGYKKCIIVTASSNGNYDFISRFFCSDERIAEDPVTGSAHCTSAPYWSRKLGKSHLKAYQASNREGILTLDVTHDRVHITGQAITVMDGKMRALG